MVVYPIIYRVENTSQVVFGIPYSIYTKKVYYKHKYWADDRKRSAKMLDRQ